MCISLHFQMKNEQTTAPRPSGVFFLDYKLQGIYIITKITEVSKIQLEFREEVHQKNYLSPIINNIKLGTYHP